MTELFIAGSTPSISDLKVSGATVTGSTLFGMAHTKHKIEGKYPYFFIGGILYLSSGGKSGVMPFQFQGNTTKLKGNVVGVPVPTEDVLVEHMTKTQTLHFKNFSADPVGFDVVLTLEYNSGSFTHSYSVVKIQAKDVNGNPLFDDKGNPIMVDPSKGTFTYRDNSHTWNGVSGNVHKATITWELTFKSLLKVELGGSEYYIEREEGSWEPNEKKKVPVTSMPPGTFQPYVKKGSFTSPVTFTNGWSSSVSSVKVEFNSLSTKLKAN